MKIWFSRATTKAIDEKQIGALSREEQHPLLDLIDPSGSGFIPVAPPSRKADELCRAALWYGAKAAGAANKPHRLWVLNDLPAAETFPLRGAGTPAIVLFSTCLAQHPGALAKAALHEGWHAGADAGYKSEALAKRHAEQLWPEFMAFCKARNVPVGGMVFPGGWGGSGDWRIINRDAPMRAFRRAS